MIENGPAGSDVHEWFEMNWSDITGSPLVGIDSTPIKRCSPWIDESLCVDYTSRRKRWCGWVCTPTGMKRICEMTRKRAAQAVDFVFKQTRKETQ